ncbi:ATP-binding cassette domain-containing protein [Rossellomorea sp. H39__3]
MVHNENDYRRTPVENIWEKTIFNAISFSIAERERVGLIGVNGTGKSSLLKLIAGIEEGDSGEIMKPNDYRIAYLPQDPSFDPDLSVLQQIFKGEAAVMKAMRRYESALLQMENGYENEGIQSEFMNAQKEMDTLNAWEASAEAKAILTKLGITEFSKRMGELSGGQKKRVALAGVLIETRTFSFWTSRRTISTISPSNGWKITWADTMDRSCWLHMTAISLTRSRIASLNWMAGSCSIIKGTMPTSSKPKPSGKKMNGNSQSSRTTSTAVSLPG